MWEYPDSFSYLFRFYQGEYTPHHQPWQYRPNEEYHPWFEHHERGQNRTAIYNQTSGPALIGSYI